MAGTAAILDEKNGAALEDAQRGDILAQPSKLAASANYSASEMAPSPKAKRKEVETPLEAFCSWIVEHQVGKKKPPPILDDKERIEAYS